VRRRKKRTGECNIKSGRTHCTFHQYSFTIRAVCHGARARRAYLCGRDVRAPRRRLGERDPRTWLSLMRARRPRTQAALGRARPAHLVVTYAGETPAHPGGAWAGATRGGRCVNDLRAAFQDAPGRCAREPMTARCRTWGARHAVPLSFVIETTICCAPAGMHPLVPLILEDLAKTCRCLKVCRLNLCWRACLTPTVIELHVCIREPDMMSTDHR